MEALLEQPEHTTTALMLIADMARQDYELADDARSRAQWLTRQGLVCAAIDPARQAIWHQGRAAQLSEFVRRKLGRV